MGWLSCPNCLHAQAQVHHPTSRDHTASLLKDPAPQWRPSGAQGFRKHDPPTLRTVASKWQVGLHFGVGATGPRRFRLSNQPGVWVERRLYFLPYASSGDRMVRPRMRVDCLCTRLPSRPPPEACALFFLWRLSKSSRHECRALLEPPPPPSHPPLPPPRPSPH